MIPIGGVEEPGTVSSLLMKRIGFFAAAPAYSRQPGFVTMVFRGIRLEPVIHRAHHGEFITYSCKNYENHVK
jgi:hypothetical protein